MQLGYASSGRYQVGQPRAYGKGVYQLLRPKSLAEVNHFKQTPFTRRVCWGCRKQLYYHWYLVFLDNIRCSRLYCYRDGTAYYHKEKMPL